VSRNLHTQVETWLVDALASGDARSVLAVEKRFLQTSLLVGVGERLLHEEEDLKAAASDSVVLLAYSSLLSMMHLAATRSRTLLQLRAIRTQRRSPQCSLRNGLSRGCRWLAETQEATCGLPVDAVVCCACTK
jgi:hypothetical protein